jgi:hypothetical protein
VATQSQRVTDKDIQSGRIRFPRSSKGRLPSKKATIHVILRGSTFQGRYDPRTAPDRARSAVLRVRTQVLAGLVKANDVLNLSVKPGGVYVLD